MKLEYEITTFPNETDGYKLASFTEGVLRVRVGSSVFLDVSGILLVEFAIVLDKWLRRAVFSPTDFYYASMDFEEEPVLAFCYDSRLDRFRLESVWSEADVGSIASVDVVAAGRHYLAQLRDELKREHDVDLDERLEEAAG